MTLPVAIAATADADNRGDASGGVGRCPVCETGRMIRVETLAHGEPLTPGIDSS